MREIPLNPVDAIWLNTDRTENLMVIECLMLLEGPVDLDRFQQVVQSRIIDRYPVFRQRLSAPSLLGGRPRWQHLRSFRIEDHLRQVVLEGEGDDLALQEYVGSFLHAPLPRDRPLWEMHLVEGLETGSAIFVRLHHALADGIALTRLLLSLTDAAPEDDVVIGIERAVKPGPFETPGPREAAAAAWATAKGVIRAPRRIFDVLRAVVQSVPILGKLLLSRNPMSAVSGSAEAAKQVVWSPPIALDRVKSLARHCDMTVNDVLVAGLAGTLHRYQLAHGTRPVDIPTMVPVNLRDLDKPLPPTLGNRFALVLLPLPSSLATPQSRLAETKRRMDKIKDSPEALLTFSLIYGIGLIGNRVSKAVIRFFSTKASGVTTNVPGPTETRYLAGTRIDAVLGWVPGSGDQTLGTCIFTYAGDVRIGFKTDVSEIPDPELIVSAYAEEMAALLALDPADESPTRADRPA